MIMKSVPNILYEYFSAEKRKRKEGGDLSERYKIAYEKYKLQSNRLKLSLQGTEYQELKR